MQNKKYVYNMYVCILKYTKCRINIKRDGPKNARETRNENELLIGRARNQKIRLIIAPEQIKHN